MKHVLPVTLSKQLLTGANHIAETGEKEKKKNTLQ